MDKLLASVMLPCTDLILSSLSLCVLRHFLDTLLEATTLWLERLADQGH